MTLGVVSPYHLTTREPPAMAGLCLLDEVVTYLPAMAASGDRDQAEESARAEPAYLDMIESWQWTRALWDGGVLTMGDPDASPDEQIRSVAALIRDDDRYATLRPLLPPGVLDEDRLMRSVARDVLRGGPDPAVSVPVAAALDRFAARRDAVVMRSAATSVAQRAEMRLGHRLFSIAIPMLTQASAARVELARELLSGPRRALAQGFAHTAGCVSVGEPSPEPDVWRGLAAAWTDAFDEHRSALLLPCEDEDDLHVIESMLAIEAISLPIDAVLRSSMAALRAMSAPRVAASTLSSRGGAVMPAIRDPSEGRHVVSLVCRVIGRG